MNLNIILQGIKNTLALTDADREIIDSVSNEYKPWVASLSKKELHLLRKYTLNSHDDSKPNRFFERLNRAMRDKNYKGADKNKLLKYGAIISSAICKHPIEQEIICYRGVDTDLFSKVEIGSKVSFDQFLSTSIVEAGALKKKFKYIIIVPRGSQGAYLEDLSIVKGQFEFLLDYRCEFLLKAKRGRVVFLEVCDE